jgi:hypothetical protein
MDFGDDKHIDVCQSIETGVKREYERNPHLTDTMTIFALESAKIAVKQHFGFAKNETVPSRPELDGIIKWCVALADERVGKVNDLTVRDFSARLDKIARSVRRHSQDGTRAYYEFVKHYVP